MVATSEYGIKKVISMP